MKPFGEWNTLKTKIDTSVRSIPHVSEGDVWWISIGVNVGFEIDGKSGLFSRPAIVLKKLSGQIFLVIPTTRRIKRGTWYIPLEHTKIRSVACLHQIRVVDYRRFFSKIERLDAHDFYQVSRGFKKLLDG